MRETRYFAPPLSEIGRKKGIITFNSRTLASSAVTKLVMLPRLVFLIVFSEIIEMEVSRKYFTSREPGTSSEYRAVKGR